MTVPNTLYTHPPRKSNSPSHLIDTLFLMHQNNDLSPDFLDAILHSLSCPKQIFIQKIRDNIPLTSRILKYFPGNDLVNYSDITLTAHILVFSLEFKNVEVVNNYRMKIEANNIWDITNNKIGRKYEIINKIKEKVRREDVLLVVDRVKELYTKMGYNTEIV